MKTNLVAIYHHPGMKPLHEAIGKQEHRTLILWALETGGEILEIFTTAIPEDARPAQALEAAADWSRGEIKMPLAKEAARMTHEAAKDAKKEGRNPDPEGARTKAAVAAAHAMGQIIGVVHVATHSTAYAAYAVQAMVFYNSHQDPEEVLEETANYLLARLDFWASVEKDARPWAKFL